MFEPTERQELCQKALEVPIVTEVKGDGGQVPVRPAANDAYKMFTDLISLVVGEKPVFMRFSSLPPSSTLELIEAVLSNHNEIMTTHPEQIYIMRAQLMPLIIRSLSDRLSFAVTVRIIRILHLIIRYHLDTLPSECEIALGLLNHMLDPEASQAWKRALCLEVFRSIYADSKLLLAIYALFDTKSEKKNIFGDNLAAFVRLATEKPAIIGLGQQSTTITGFEDGKAAVSDQAVAEAGALAGVIGGPVSDNGNSARPLGISTQWSTLKTPCIEHLDKSDPPALPDTYIYSLVLTCITNISESLAKFVLPLTVHHEGRSRRKTKADDSNEQDANVASPDESSRRLSRTQSFRKKTIPVNPLDLTEHPAYASVQTSTNLVTECWPAVLATCSTFLNAALDTEYYRALVRSIQKFTQVAGLLRLSTPRDAFLTTMGKAAVPSNLLLANVSSFTPAGNEKAGVFSNAKGMLSVDSFVSQSSSMSADKNRHSSHDSTPPALSPRNLLCLRALLNLAIALGPTLQSAWSIIFETLQVADLVMAMSSQSSGRASGLEPRSEGGASVEKLGAETSAVQGAARRLFESTVDFPNESFSEVLQALCSLLNSMPSESGQRTPNASGRPQILHQRRLGSVSGISLNAETNSRDSAFALNKIGELAALNEARLAQYDPADSGWDVLVKEVVQFSTDSRKATPTRLLAADILARTVKEIAELSMSDEQRELIQARILAALQRQIAELYHYDGVSKTTINDADIRVHQITLEALKNVIEQCGESLVAGWASVIESLMSVFAPRQPSLQGRPNEMEDTGTDRPLENAPDVISRSLARSAFATVNLVCSDFMTAVPDACLFTLLELLRRFCSQQEDLNMSLTAITFFWNVSDYLQSQADLSSLPKTFGDTEKDIKLAVFSNSQKGETPALWLQVLLNLSSITVDERVEVRNSAIQTIQRIFENCSDKLSSAVWLLCLRTILFGMVQSNLEKQRDIRAQSIGKDELKDWGETTKAVLRTVSILKTTYMEKLDASQLGDSWSELLDLLQRYFEYRSHALGASVFNTITGVLTQTDDIHIWSTEPLLKTAAVWKSYFPSPDAWQEGDEEDNQDAFVAYADAFKAIYHIAYRPLAADLPSMLANLEACVVNSDEVAYSSDVDSMTALQSRIVECLSIVKTEGPEIPSYLMRLLGRFITLPYETLEKCPEKRGPTFVALSKASMTLLQETTIKHIDQEKIYTSNALSFALGSLARPVQEKYVWQREGRSPTLWQKATTTSVTILQSALSHIGSNKDTWINLVDTAHYITRAQLPSNPPQSLEKDEKFDMDSFTRLCELITLPLGSASLPDSLRRAYARNVFSSSLIHNPLSGEVPDVAAAPLEELYKIRLGQTAELGCTWRPAMGYKCLSELFSLVAVHDGSSERIKLAQAAAPYLILRCALPIKTYIADHPLRGRMPAPESQRQELLFVLGELYKLRCEPQAIPDAPGVSGTGARAELTMSSTTPVDKSNASDTMSPANDSGSNAKRKSDDGPAQPRAKRNRYISIACNECKRRKIKCNGQTPCQRCGNLNLDCQYSPNCCNNFKESDEFKHMSAHITSLQQQVDDLFHNISTLRTQVDVHSNASIGTPFPQDYQQTPMLPPQSARSRSKSFSKHPRFHGPTSNAFNVGVARSSLKTMGINAGEEGEDDGILTRDVTPRASPAVPNAMLPKRSMHIDKDPIWAISKHEALRLVHVWHEEMGVMYPILELGKVLRYTDMLFTFVEAAARSGLMQGSLPGSDAMMDEQISVLKLVLAITLVLEGGGKDPLGEKLFANVHKVVDKALSEPVSLHGITLLVLTAMYHFMRDDEALAWRVSGLAARHCLELGLHRRDTYAALFPDPEGQASAIRTFWTIYVLDRRWSFGTGMPFALQDADIDSNLPKPDASSHESSPYLNAMISYSVIGSKVWRSIADVGHQDKINKEDISFLDFQVLNWHRSIPESLKFIHPDSGRQVEPPARLVHRLQVVLYLRANQMRILIYRPVLHTATTIMENLDFAHVVVKVAKDTIRILTYLNQTSDIYRSQQTMFNYFLISALAVLFLAVAHAPADFSQQSRDEFYMALELVRGLSSNSYVSKRLWRTIKTIKEVGPRLGLVVRSDDTHDAHSSAAVAMAGLAGHSMDDLALFSNGRNSNNLDTPHGMASDLTTLFEAAGGIFNLNGFGASSTEMSNPNGEFVNGFGQENDELARIMRDLF
ncbi:fungal specific transcription factor [Stemphylium lycopersici]|nr:fungal specific transcription factor [Stemphylium lycopersici]